MKENTQEKSLVRVKENSFFLKIKNFFRNLFSKKENIVQSNIIEEYNETQIEKESSRNSFMESIRNIEDDETRLLKLQKQYRSGEIKEEDLTKEQVNALCSLYDKQIIDLKKSNQMRKQRLLEYRRKLQTNN